MLSTFVIVFSNVAKPNEFDFIDIFWFLYSIQLILLLLLNCRWEYQYQKRHPHIYTAQRTHRKSTSQTLNSSCRSNYHPIQGRYQLVVFVDFVTIMIYYTLTCIPLRQHCKTQKKTHVWFDFTHFALFFGWLIWFRG